jgi:hypothetical protein
LDVASLIGILGQSDNQTPDQGFFTQTNQALALVSINTSWVHNYHAEIYFILLYFYTSYVGQFCPASNNHELTVHDNCTILNNYASQTLTII